MPEYKKVPERGTPEELLKLATRRYGGRPVVWHEGLLCFELTGTKGLNKTPVPGTWELVNN